MLRNPAITAAIRTSRPNPADLLLMDLRACHLMCPSKDGDRLFRTPGLVADSGAAKCRSPASPGSGRRGSAPSEVLAQLAD
ncbi:hypothetical protein GCM10022403_046300 [Streptomyces coacervatus]|uniref:Uncharacterized protein n=1 Tax=Streptomyces coacervatus TaxID=647381 RepID=A0ABP7HYS8_9ACTN